jgi:hypothetical protein
VISIFLLLPLYAIGIQYQRKGLWYATLPVALLALVLDFFLNYTELALLTLDLPRWGEWTFSTRLARLRWEADWRGDIARYITRVLDAIAPSGKHIQ